MAAGDIKVAIASASNITISLAPAGVGLASGSAREATAVDNGTNLYLDAEVQLAIKLAAGSPAGAKAIYVYAYASADGTNYDDNATGSDNAITLRSPTNFKLVKTINTPDSGGLTYKAVVPSIAAAFAGILPKKWGIVIENQSGVALSNTEGDHTKQYVGIYSTVAAA